MSQRKRRTRKQKIAHQERLEKLAAQRAQEKAEEKQDDLLIRLNVHPLGQYKFTSLIEFFGVKKFWGFNFYKLRDSIGTLYRPSPTHHLRREVEMFREEVEKNHPRYVVVDVAGAWRNWRLELYEDLADITTPLGIKERWFLPKVDYPITLK